MIYQIKKIICAILKMIRNKNLTLNLKNLFLRIIYRPNSYNYAFKQYTADLTHSFLIKNYFNNLKNNGFFIHIGICDYDKDFFKPYFEKKNFKGLLIEANPFYISEIKKSMNSNFKILNVLVDEDEENKFLYHVKLDCLNKYPAYVKGICSVNKKNILFHGVKPVDIEKTMVPSKKLSNLINELNIEKIDFLIIDVEGLEYNILNDFLKNTNHKPNIMFEMKFMKKDQIFKILDLLKIYKYEINLFKNDFICLNKEKV